MMQFRQTVLGKIRAATDKQEVEHIISYSVQQLKDKNVNGHIIQRFILGMDRTLHQAKKDETSKETEQNMNIAIALFRKLQQV